MGPLFSDQFGAHASWRRDTGQRLKHLAAWLRDHDLLDAAADERLRRLESQVRQDKVMVAFVAEFSRGKSELINAIFFSGYGRRIMPASAGRTTMCPTEVGYDPAQPTCLRLLPIEIRLQPQSLMDWRASAEGWERVDLDLKDPDQMAQALERVSDVRRVTPQAAAALGLWSDTSPERNPLVQADGLVEIPRWRHALVNLPHPLLKQGLVILDTPGLNAIGAEPELTLGLIPQAHAVVFLLGADTGVTRSDLAVWREHLEVASDRSHMRLVVLNKIDTLGDPLRTAEEVQQQIDRQRESAARILDLPQHQVIAVSAQKGLLAKIHNNTDLLMDSRLPDLELALGQGLLGQRMRVLRSAVETSLGDLQSDVGRAIAARWRDLAEQLVELKGLRGKNAAVVRHMRALIDREQADFSDSGTRIQAVRSVHLKLLRDLTEMLGTATLRQEMAHLTHALCQPGIKLGVKTAYARTFRNLRAGLARAQEASAEIHTMLASAYRQLNTDYGFSLQAPPAPDFARYVQDLDTVEQAHQHYLGVTHVLKLAQGEFAERLVRALTSRLRVVFESALSEVEMWNKSAAAQLDGQLRERHRNFGRRLEAVDRIQDAAQTLDARIEEIQAQEAVVRGLTSQLTGMTQHVVETCPVEEIISAQQKTA